MPRMQVYVPDDLYRAVKDRGLPASTCFVEPSKPSRRSRGP